MKNNDNYVGALATGLYIYEIFNFFNNTWLSVRAPIKAKRVGVVFQYTKRLAQYASYLTTATGF